MRFIDVGVNLNDDMFAGVYNEKKAHDPDHDLILKRAREAGVERAIVTAGFWEECNAALELVRRLADVEGAPRLYNTIGVHPTRCQEFETAEGGPDAHLARLQELIEANRGRVVAVGECGLDYDRLHFCPKEVQLKHFERQFELAERTGLPLFLHNRATGDDFADLVRRNRHRFKSGVAHCFTGGLEEARALIDLDLYIGVTGCSLKTEENLAVVREIPPERLILETDAPWCDIRPTHAGYKHVLTQWPSVKKEKFERGKTVKNRTEPCHIRQVAEVVAGVRGEEPAALAAAAYENSMRLFFPSEL
eukprot:tig00021493_g21905.t1